MKKPPPQRPYLLPHAAALPDPVATPQAVQQLRDAGFPDAEQAALTSAFLRVLALWTQQANAAPIRHPSHGGKADGADDAPHPHGFEGEVFS